MLQKNFLPPSSIWKMVITPAAAIPPIQVADRFLELQVRIPQGGMGVSF
jgi:hypothetical protein